MFDGFDNKTLDNHLLSANGVVTADYSVQLAYSTGNLNPALIDEPGENTLRASERAYHARYANTEALAFVADKTRWPKGMTPVAAEPMVNIPVYAKSYLTEAHADLSRRLAERDAQRLYLGNQPAALHPAHGRLAARAVLEPGGLGDRPGPSRRRRRRRGLRGPSRL
jgi:hypothetical protein